MPEIKELQAQLAESEDRANQLQSQLDATQYKYEGSLRKVEDDYNNKLNTLKARVKDAMTYIAPAMKNNKDDENVQELLREHQRALETLYDTL